MALVAGGSGVIGGFSDGAGAGDIASGAVSDLAVGGARGFSWSAASVVLQKLNSSSRIAVTCFKELHLRNSITQSLINESSQSIAKLYRAVDVFR